ncbi:MAG: Kazal-type serine protease inhibitor domain-containing protein [Polyangiales bacterium]
MHSLICAVLAGAFLLIPKTSLAEAGAGVLAADQARIRTHLSSVEAYLRRQDSSHLTPSQREARAENIEHLHQYWTTGVFPRNTLRDYPTPIFIDAAGRACAVGYLMIQSGWEAEADAVAERENLAYVNDIQSPEVRQWIAQSGLTLQEAAWIQPSYDWEYCGDKCPCDEEPVCGANGETYINACVAEACDPQGLHISGCCTGVDSYESWVNGAWDCRCSQGIVPPDDPCADQSYGSGIDLCTDLVDPPSPPGCSAVSGVPASSWTHLLLASLSLIALRRRRRRRQ